MKHKVEKTVSGNKEEGTQEGRYVAVTLLTKAWVMELST